MIFELPYPLKTFNRIKRNSQGHILENEGYREYQWIDGHVIGLDGMPREQD